jgi:SAM-dependent methyltransferase
VTRADRQFGRVAMDAMRLGFADDVFDAVVSSFALFHIPDPPGALAAVRNAMRRGAAIAIAVWGTGEDFPAMTAWDEESDRIGLPADPVDSGPGDDNEQVESPDKLKGVLERAGFVEVRAESAEWLLRWEFDEFLDWRRRMGSSRRRLAQLDPARREETFAKLANYVARMGSDALVHRGEVVLAFATA